MINTDIRPILGTVTINGIESNIENKKKLSKQIAYIRKNSVLAFKNDIVLAEIGTVGDEQEYKHSNINKRI